MTTWQVVVFAASVLGACGLGAFAGAYLMHRTMKMQADHELENLKATLHALMATRAKEQKKAAAAIINRLNIRETESPLMSPEEVQRLRDKYDAILKKEAEDLESER